MGVLSDDFATVDLREDYANLSLPKEAKFKRCNKRQKPIKESIARRIISREQIIYWISSFKDGDITSEKYRQQLIDTFVHAVFVYDDKIVITYNYSGENNTATISDLDLSSPPKIRPSAFGRWPYFWASPARRAGTNLLDGVQEVLPGVVHGVTHVLHGAAHAGLHGPLPG